jgi:hypothetical protein
VAETNKTVEQELNTSDENSCWYNWTVTAYDGEDYGVVSSKWGFKIMPIILLTLNPATVEFGNMSLGEINDTTNGFPGPFVLQNDGTVVADLVNVTADSHLWIREPSPTSYFQLNVSDNESGSINLSGSATTWTDISLSNITVIDSLNYSDTHDSARIDIRVEVPGDEPHGTKAVNLTFYGIQT